METILPPLDIQLSNGIWKQSLSHSTENRRMHLRSFFPLGSMAPTSIPSNTEWSPRFVGMRDVLSLQVSPLKEKRHVRLPSIDIMINRDPSPKSLIPMQTYCMDFHKQHQDTKTVSLRQSELSNMTCEQQTPALSCCINTDKVKRTSNAKLCGIVECKKRAKAGGFCIAHGGGLRCSEVSCTKHAVSLGLCISHGGGKRCNVEGCLNASRKNGVCWSHGGKRLCKIEGCNKGPKSGGYCWRHGSKMKL
ncbi:hypothetical protein KXD40_006655 [Peronospora effusa]|uniref:WRKY19-like zinc finger domain-containing protein n=1 Tax=Peronospora effusa TaxID=542832 RepID=A0A3M6VQ31_9STRA|nr:hypothetical protein DD238_007027 [Peronospora effusa]RQM12888.1 hypothetical protein DD237_007619 [Peronospora effusa]UIZ24951.1 hypothetical protein KXD40_006655 [Peronospora effusa]CAI5719492.1 unnamed protein product [Peronospora effusa]